MSGKRKMSAYLPQELLEKVLVRLPVKVLLRCRSVCKNWYNLISTPQFLSEHLNLSKLNKTQFLVKSSSTEFGENYVIFNDNKNVRALERVVRIDFQEPRFFRFLNVVGSCNGVVCIPLYHATSESGGGSEEVVILWNPSIRRSLRLPKSKLIADSRIGKAYTFGFGFDHVNNDYKVLRVYSFLGEHPVITNLIQFITKVEIFRLSTGLWEDISEKVPFNCISRRSQADFKGVVHWIGVDSSDEVFIVTFDMHDEVFGKIKLPKNPVSGDWMHMLDRYLLVFEEKLFLFRQLSTGAIEDNHVGDGPHEDNHVGDGYHEDNPVRDGSDEDNIVGDGSDEDNIVGESSYHGNSDAESSYEGSSDGESSYGDSSDGESSYGDSSDGESSYGYDLENSYERKVQYECWQFQMKFDIWKMEEYPVSESWTKLHNGSFNISAQPIGFRKNGEILLSAVCDGLVSNKIGKNEVTILGECEDQTFHPSGSSYTESLVLLDKTIPSTGNDDIVKILQKSHSKNEAERS